MKCVNDQNEMEKGHLRDGREWVSGPFKHFFSLSFGGSIVVAWKCPKCGKIELQTEVK